ncbi:MAG: FecR domain-containing protein, partial [Deltaproteobacteria bacterium]|nr:FecR domain-containing protein [Deltaproteobacteria bacterium]
MTQDHKHSMLSDEQLESLLLDMRPSVPDEPLHPKVDDLTRRRVAGAVLAELEDMPRAQTRRRDVRKLSAVAAAAAASAAAVLIGLYALSEKPAQVVVSPVAGVALPDSDVENAFENVVPQSWFSLLHGEVNCGDKAVKLGSTVPMEKWIETRNGQSAFALPTGIAVGLADNSAVRVFWNGNRRYEVEVNQGMALFSVDPKRSREGFFVRTPQGILQVTGTLFTVVVEDEGDVSVHLHRGQLDIFSGSRKNEHMTAGHTALLRDEAVGVEPLQENADVANQMYKMGCIDAGQVFSELSNVDCSAGRTAVGRQGAKTGAEGAGRGTERSVPADKVTVEELLRRGSEARKAKQWSEAAAAYRTLIRLYPG